MRIMFLGIAVLLAGCTTPEYQAQRSACESIWLAKMPPRYEEVVRTDYHYIEIPSGKSVCVTKTSEDGSVHKICEESTQEIPIPHTRTVTVDSREIARGAQIEICVHNACLKRYGDPRCRPL
ncbi:MAG: hypothetical protein OXF19_04080 [Hyphomicrobiales bacterium]|nr:hypothetical protein [Hyphomicrobiales bacterium]